MKKIVLTGANGFLSSRLSENLKENFTVFPLTRKDLDVTNKEKTLSLITDLKPDYVIHTAAIAETKFCNDNPLIAHKINVEGTINVAEACNKSKSKLIFASSEQVYNGNEESGPYFEDIVPNPNTEYGKNKLESEARISEILDDFVILRLTWIFGLPERNKKVNSNILWNIISALINKKTLELPTNEYRGMTYVYNLIDQFQKILDLPNGIYNVGSENNLSTYEIGEIILKELNLENKLGELILKDEYKYKIRDLRINNQKLKKHNIIFPETEDAIKACLKEFNLIK